MRGGARARMLTNATARLPALADCTLPCDCRCLRAARALLLQASVLKCMSGHHHSSRAVTPPSI